MITPDHRYRPCVGVALFNAQGRVFIGHRRAKGYTEIYAPRVIPLVDRQPHPSTLLA